MTSIYDSPVDVHDYHHVPLSHDIPATFTDPEHINAYAESRGLA